MEEPQICPVCRNREKPMKRIGTQLHYCQSCGFILFHPEPELKTKTVTMHVGTAIETATT